jgi:hypothetical protein
MHKPNFWSKKDTKKSKNANSLHVFLTKLNFETKKKQQDATELTKTKNPLRTFLQPIFFFSNFFGTKHEHRKRIST